MEGPYINTKLSTIVSLRPDQMDNKVYINLKRNLEEKINNRCYKDYGYISNVYEILEYKDGIIEAENLMGSAVFDISFSCRLCKPLKNHIIVAKIKRVNKVLITAENGPILIIITNDRVNSDVFFTDNNNNIRYKKEGSSEMLKASDYVKISIRSVVFNDRDTKIKAMGYLDDIASDEEIQKHFEEMYINDELTDYNQYVEEENLDKEQTKDKNKIKSKMV